MSRRSSPEGFSRLFRIDGSWWDTLVAGIAELIGSAILVFIGCMGCVGSLIGPPPHLQVALTFGFAVASIVHIIGHFSHFHISPAVSISTLILGLTSLTTTGINILAQTLGAIIGYGMLRVVTPAEFLHAGNASAVDSFCVTVVHENISPIQGMLIEAVATGILILFVGACTDPRNRKNPDARAVKFALIISMLAFATGPYTGCSMNPARSFAPALWNNNWKHQWVYWLGPIVGSLVSSFLYKMLFWPKQQPREDVPEGTALNSINTDEPMIIGHFSHFHISPAARVCTPILGLTSLTTTGVNILAQTLEAIVGYGMLRVITTPAEFLQTGHQTTNNSRVMTVNENIWPIQGMLVESMAHGVLILFLWNVAANTLVEYY